MVLQYNVPGSESSWSVRFDPLPVICVIKLNMLTHFLSICSRRTHKIYICSYGSPVTQDFPLRFRVEDRSNYGRSTIVLDYTQDCVKDAPLTPVRSLMSTVQYYVRPCMR
jgi:hypothetical protein